MTDPGNTLGGLLLGSTLLGADPGDDSSGGGSGSGVGNMLGGFFLGETMLGGDQAGGGSAPPPTGGSVQPLAVTISTATAVTGAFQTFLWQMVANPAGNCIVSNAYLNAPWALSATTVNTTGLTYFNGNTAYTITPGIAQGVRSQTGTFVLARTGGFSGQAYRTNIATGVEQATSFVGLSSGADSFTWNLDANAGFFISRVEIASSGGVLTGRWDWNVEPKAVVTGLVFNPTSMFAAPTGSASVVADLTNTIYSPVALDAASNDSAATVAGEATQSVLRGSITGSTSVVAGLGLHQVITGANTEFSRGDTVVTGNPVVAKVLAGDMSGGTAVAADVVPTYYANGQASVTGDVGRYLSPSAINGSTTVTANPVRLGPYVGDSIGSATVVADDRLAMFLLANAVVGSAGTAANLTFPRSLAGGAPVGSSTASGSVVIYTLDPYDAVGFSTVVGSLHYLGDIVRLSGDIVGTTDTVGQDRERFRFGQQNIVGTSAVAAEVRKLWALAGTPVGTSTVTFDHLTVHTIPPGPVTCFATVVGEAIMDSKFGGTSHGVASLVINASAAYRIGTATPQGTADVHGRLGVHPQDFEVGPCDGSAAVHGQIVLRVLTLAAKSQGGRIPFLDGLGRETGSFNDTLATGRLGIAFTFPGTARSAGTSEVEAILLLNDSGLIRGNSRIDAALDRLSTEYAAHVAGFASAMYAYLDRPGDMKGDVNDAYAGVGRWYPGSQFLQQLYYDEGAGRMAPFRNDLPTTDPNYDTGIYHTGSNSYQIFNNTERRNAHKWDGTYAPFTRADVPNLPSEPWFVDPDQTGMDPYSKRYLSGTMPGPLRRRYQLADPGELGGWFVDAVPFNYRDIAMRAAPVGEARFSEPQSTVDMDLELKSSMKGVSHGAATVAALALLLSFRHIMATGNVTALRYLLQTHEGNFTKSKDTRLPISRKNSELIQPIHQTNALFV